MRSFLVATALLLPIAPAAELVRGPMLGHTTGTEARIWVKADAAARLGIRLGKVEAELADIAQAEAVALTAEHGFAGTVKVSGLEPFTAYHYQITLDGKTVGEPARLTTAQAPDRPGRMRFAFTSCLGKTGAEAADGWALLAAAGNVDMVLLLGDNHYADSTARKPQTAAYLSHRHPHVAGFNTIARRTPIYAIWDDHDYGPNDSDGTAAGKEESLATFKDHWANPAYGEPDNPGIYFSFTRAGVDFFMLDVRYHRSPDKAPQDEAKTMLGARQLAWLKAGLKASKAKVKVIASGSEWQMNGHQDSWTSYKRERGEILDFLRDEKITGVLLISGDRHFTGGYQVRGEVIEITAGPLGKKSYPTKNLPEMFMNHGEKSMYAVFDIDTSAEPNPRVVLEVVSAEKELGLEKREFTWGQVLGEEKLPVLPAP